MNKKYIIALIAIILVIISGLTFAYFSAKITGIESSSTIIISGGTMGINYSDNDKNILISNAIPGDEVNKTFTLTGNNTTINKMYYKIILVTEENTFNTTLTYELTNTNVVSSGKASSTKTGDVGKTGTQEIGNGYFDGEATNELHDYNLKITFPNDPSKEQNSDQAAIYSGYIIIEGDVEPKEGTKNEYTISYDSTTYELTNWQNNYLSLNKKAFASRKDNEYGVCYLPDNASSPTCVSIYWLADNSKEGGVCSNLDDTANATACAEAFKTKINYPGTCTSNKDSKFSYSVSCFDYQNVDWGFNINITSNLSEITVFSGLSDLTTMWSCLLAEEAQNSYTGMCYEGLN